MTKNTLVNEIRARLKEEKNIELTKPQITAVIDAQSDIILEVIATMDFLTFPWGTIKGTTSSPTKLVGTASDSVSSGKNAGFSWWKLGVPKIEWSKLASECEKRPAKEFFELQEQRYTSLARKFRQAAGLPEIPEFEGLSEEKITELNKKADDINFKKLPLHKQYQKLKDDRHNATKIRGAHKIWEEENHIPLGALEETWTGKIQDAVDRGIEHVKLDESQGTATVPELYNRILYIKEFAQVTNKLSKHPEVEEYYELYKKKMEEGNYTPLQHYEVTEEKLKRKEVRTPNSITIDELPKLFERVSGMDYEKRRVRLEELSKQEKELLWDLGYIEVSAEDYEKVFGEKKEEKEKDS